MRKYTPLFFLLSTNLRSTDCRNQLPCDTEKRNRRLRNWRKCYRAHKPSNSILTYQPTDLPTHIAAGSLRQVSDCFETWFPIVCMLSHFSHVQLFVTPLTIAHQGPLSMGFSRQKYWSGLPFPDPGALPDPGIEPTSLTSPSSAGGSFITEPPGKPSLLQ